MRTAIVDDVAMGVLSRADLEAYQRDGFVRLPEAFPRALALRCRDLLWDQIDENPCDSSTWLQPVVRVGSQAQPGVPWKNNGRLRGLWPE